MCTHLTYGLLDLNLAHQLLLQDSRGGVHLVLEPHRLSLPGRGPELVDPRLVLPWIF